MEDIEYSAEERTCRLKKKPKKKSGNLYSRADAYNIFLGCCFILTVLFLFFGVIYYIMSNRFHSIEDFEDNKLDEKIFKITSWENNSIYEVTLNIHQKYLYRKTCQIKYGLRKFLDEAEEKIPPIIYSFPGSGNTWCRLLIEHVTGIYTGSVYSDPQLKSFLPGEFYCGKRVSAIKVHPNTHGFLSGEHPIGIGKGIDSLGSTKMSCKLNGVNEFKRAILLIRNPFEAIFSEFQRRILKSHTEKIGKENLKFEWNVWMEHASELSHQYVEMSMHYTDMIRAYGKENVMYVRYEDLIQPKIRLKRLSSLYTFITGKRATADILQCAFYLSETTAARRPRGPKSANLTDAYAYGLGCKVWKVLGQQARAMGYGPIDIHSSCDRFKPLVYVKKNSTRKGTNHNFKTSSLKL